MRKNHQMKDEANDENRDAVSGWEDEGGALQSEAARRIDNARTVRDRRRPTQERLDESHQSDIRGEHRYDDAHQTEAEQEARQERDDLKQRLAHLHARRVP
jgi:hypothetical protein